MKLKDIGYNPYLPEEYAERLKASANTAEVKAWLEGNWDVESERCTQTCDKGSRCILKKDHEPADRHETEHGCICYDAGNMTVGKVVKL